MIREMESELKELRTQVVEYRHHAQTLQEIYGSSAWQLVQWLRRARLILAPTGSPQERVVKAIMRIFRSHRSSHAKGGSLPPGKAEIVIELPESVDKIHLKGQQPKGIDVLVFPVMEWESRVQRPQQIATQFARSGYRVFYLYPYFRGDGRTVVRHVSKNIFEVLLPASEPTNAYKDSMSEALENTCLGALESLRQEFGIGQAVSFVDLPFWTPLAFRLRRQFGWKVVYDCMDYHPGFVSNSPEMLQQEDRLSRQCDLLLVTSQFLLKEKHGLNHNLVHVPNGADFDHFQPSVDVRPHELAGIAGPLIGYYGAIADWFDTDLIRSLAEAKPAWQFVLIGSTKYAHLDPIKDISNVHLFGEKPYADLPAYLHAFDVAIIPFKPMPLTQATNPVKLFEYLSAGKAIVATDLEELRHYTDLVRLASSVEGWLLAIEEALGDYAPQRVQERIDYARGNTWKDRFDQIEKEISRLLQE